MKVAVFFHDDMPDMEKICKQALNCQKDGMIAATYLKWVKENPLTVPHLEHLYEQ